MMPVALTGPEALSGGEVGPDPGSRCRPGASPWFAAGALVGLSLPAWRFGLASQDRLTAALCFPMLPTASDSSLRSRRRYRCSSRFTARDCVQ